MINEVMNNIVNEMCTMINNNNQWTTKRGKNVVI
jgi:hypothetical protein